MDDQRLWLSTSLRGDGRAARGKALWAKVSNNTLLTHSRANYVQDALNKDENTVANASNGKKKKNRTDTTIQTVSFFCTFLVSFSSTLSDIWKHERSYYQHRATKSLYTFPEKISRTDKTQQPFWNVLIHSELLCSQNTSKARAENKQQQQQQQ